MLAWLNQHLGTDWATYIGMLLGFLALFGVGASLSSRKKVIKQKSSVRDGISIQVAGDAEIKNVDKANIRSE
ncbi:MAG: hypothetical protein AB7C98_01135 [Acidithiobacillus sp.]